MGMFVNIDAEQYRATLTDGTILKYLPDVKRLTGLDWIFRQQENEKGTRFEIYAKSGPNWQIVYFPFDDKEGCTKNELIAFIFGILSGVNAANKMNSFTGLKKSST